MGLAPKNLRRQDRPSWHFFEHSRAIWENEFLKTILGLPPKKLGLAELFSFSDPKPNFLPFSRPLADLVTLVFSFSLFPEKNDNFFKKIFYFAERVGVRGDAISSMGGLGGEAPQKKKILPLLAKQ